MRWPQPRLWSSQLHQHQNPSPADSLFPLSPPRKALLGGLESWLPSICFQSVWRGASLSREDCRACVPLSQRLALLPLGNQHLRLKWRSLFPWQPWVFSHPSLRRPCFYQSSKTGQDLLCLFSLDADPFVTHLSSTPQGLSGCRNWLPICPELQTQSLGKWPKDYFCLRIKTERVETDTNSEKLDQTKKPEGVGVKAEHRQVQLTGWEGQSTRGREGARACRIQLRIQLPQALDQVLLNCKATNYSPGCQG